MAKAKEDKNRTETAKSATAVKLVKRVSHESWPLLNSKYRLLLYTHPNFKSEKRHFVVAQLRLHFVTLSQRNYIISFSYFKWSTNDLRAGALAYFSEDVINT